MISLREHRRARWRLRNEVRRWIAETVAGVRYRIDTERLEALRKQALHGGPVARQAYWERYKRHWRLWG